MTAGSIGAKSTFPASGEFDFGEEPVEDMLKDGYIALMGRSLECTAARTTPLMASMYRCSIN